MRASDSINRRAGFTLIELLVVISIIGVLASIVLVPLNSARKKGKDTRVVSDVQQVRITLESNRLGNQTYPDLTATGISTAASTSQNINIAVADSYIQGGGIFAVTNGANPTAYAVYGQMISAPSLYYCLDSLGKSNLAESSVTTSYCQ